MQTSIPASGPAPAAGPVLCSGLDSESQFVYGEERDDFLLLQQEYFHRFQPLVPEERFLVDTLLRNEWILRRLFRVESHLWEYHSSRASRHDGVPLGEALTKATDVFTRLQRRITLAERSYKDALAELRRLQANRKPTAAPPQPQPLKRPAPQVPSFPISGSITRPPASPPPPADSSPLPAHSHSPVAYSHRRMSLEPGEKRAGAESPFR